MKIRTSGRKSPKLDVGVAAFARSLLHTMRPVKHGYFCAEVSKSYVQANSGNAISWNRARDSALVVAKQRLVQPIERHIARGYGHPIRKAVFSMTGQHYLVHASNVERLRALASSAELPAMPAPASTEWHPVIARHSASGRRYVACPFHHDIQPSMVLWPNADGVSGSGKCFVCQEDGRPLTVYWRDRDGTTMVRKSRRFVGTTFANTIHGESGPAVDAPTDVEVSEQECEHVLFSPVYDVDLRPCQTHLNRVYGKMRGKSRFGSDYGMEQSASATICLMDMLICAESRAAKQAEKERLALSMHTTHLGDVKQVVPSKHVALDVQSPVSYRKWTTKSGRVVHVARKWTGSAVTHVLVDLDKFAAAPQDNEGLAQLKGEFVALAKRFLLTGEVGLVRTSERGIQVVFQLPVAKRLEWYADRRTQAYLARLDDACLALVAKAGFVGGHADVSVHAPNRYMRKPGARIDKQGRFYISRLVFATKTKGAEPKGKGWRG